MSFHKALVNVEYGESPDQLFTDGAKCVFKPKSLWQMTIFYVFLDLDHAYKLRGNML